MASSEVVKGGEGMAWGGPSVMHLSADILTPAFQWLADSSPAVFSPPRPAFRLAPSVVVWSPRS